MEPSALQTSLEISILKTIKTGKYFPFSNSNILPKNLQNYPYSINLAFLLLMLDFSLISTVKYTKNYVFLSHNITEVLIHYSNFTVPEHARMWFHHYFTLVSKAASSIKKELPLLQSSYLMTPPQPSTIRFMQQKPTFIISRYG